MQQKQTFSAQTLALSVTAAELGRAIFGAGQTGSVRAALLSNVLAAAAFLLLAALASVNASRLNRPGFAGKCICLSALVSLRTCPDGCNAPTSLLGTVCVYGLHRSAAVLSLGRVEPRL